MTHGEPAQTSATAIAERLEFACKDRSCREIGRLTQTHPETVRRYLRGGRPPACFIASFCSIFGVSADWLLLGEGPMLRTEISVCNLSQASPRQLLLALADQIDRIAEDRDPDAPLARVTTNGRITPGTVKHAKSG
ncbi:MAG: hypothetical protein AAFX05_01150 [Planctomycetota bacterium]